MPNDSEKKEPLKVTDRRAFTIDGERRKPDAETSREEPLRGEGFEVRQAPPERTPREPAANVEFNSFILSLASTAFIQMGELADPVTSRVEVNLEGAQQMIDILDMLHHKTRGNLEAQEEEFFSGILYELKMKFTQKARVR